jgi:Ca2+-transporting ATPase
MPFSCPHCHTLAAEADERWAVCAAQDNSLLQMPPWCNPWLLVAMALSFGLHFLILYVPVLAGIFSIVPLSLNEWALVLLFASPVVLIDEMLKFLGRNLVNPRTELPALEAARKKSQ